MKNFSWTFFSLASSVLSSSRKDVKVSQELEQGHSNKKTEFRISTIPEFKETEEK